MNFFYSDVDECAAEPCDVLETCTNTIGSFFCECLEGYRRNAGVCSSKQVLLELNPLKIYIDPIVMYCNIC